ncbi:L,D-transpeptidase family protein [Novosphingobium sp. FSY-8]|uniref:L,D-transpeptidase family protein n=2 Tax=Novosphingobium ovatum TaxID=1908523 RepID=A0ABW9XGY9_9SPHN|nr:L,D-transpeptidase family protein [Novosphingobium ovatum]
MARLGILTVGAVATALGGIALIRADERLGTAHLSWAELRAHRPDLVLEDAPGAPIADDEATSIANRAPGEGEDAPAPRSTASPFSVDRSLVVKRILPISGAIKYGEWHWDESGVPEGPIVIAVDLQARVLSIFRGGYEIGAAAVLLGTQDKPTPLGVFPISQKNKDHVSSLYDAPMPYMMRLTNDGISIHASNVRNGYASHGCIGVPLPFAQKLFAAARLGDKVFITRGKKITLGDALVD